MAQIFDVFEKQPWAEAFLLAYERTRLRDAAPHDCTTIQASVDRDNPGCLIPPKKPFVVWFVHMTEW
jgi:hypothetical protein